MEYFINCNTSTLAPYTANLDQQRALHLYRRLGFSASVATINQAAGQSAGAIVDNLVDQAINMAPIPAPTWANWTNANYPEDDDASNQIKNQQKNEFQLAYANSLLNNNLRDRLSFFWSNHFVTELDVYNCNPYLYEYINCLQRNSIGNFKTFTSEIGLTNAMLYYLDGVFNNGNNPNENYGRELYELFTLGEGNGYTEEDIIETARALSGYVERGEIGCSPVTFDATKHDAGSKTILGQTGNWGYDDVIDILFDQRPTEIAEFVCRKLYEFFVHPDSRDEANNAQTIINGLAATFVSNNFEIAPVLRQLFKSQHFFDDEAIGVIIKSPIDFYFHTLNETDFAYTDTNVAEMVNYSTLLSQEIFDPFDVAGWQRNRSWINTNFMIGRWLTIESILENFYMANNEQFRTLGLDISGNAGLTSTNPDVVARLIIDFILPKGLLDEPEYSKAFAIFRSDIEEVYYEGGNQESWTLATWQQAPFQVYLLLQYLARQPEYQLK
ncbi:DUF1800 domain-containing protein [Maribacter hydrothermalis]|uniref:DUF1800 domain-containing protein n=1 Tax=Maribacter hydrothermalis TaxID=1836467 RepID=A0A1B7ZF11_9FLAO|nr:DUF1800 domain-containing protein [Maribacter hydrothermalis]APQ17649.1 hypothetical protein BTR34_10040 [Maribacter hydrothermalis]OBR42124.1 hypothetical protein A9200_01670 [Maribacter hydrothermalis]